MPLPGTRVIPRGWSAHHRPTANGAMTGECTITEAPAGRAVPVFDEALGYSPAPEQHPLYAGPCRVQRGLANESQVVVADREVTLRTYQVSIPIDGTDPIATNALVTMTVCEDDPQLVGAALRVRDVRAGTLAWERDLICDLVQATTR